MCSTGALDGGCTASTPIAHPSKAQAGDEEEESARDRFEKELKACKQADNHVGIRDSASKSTT